MPHPRNSFFTGREQTFSRLAQAFQGRRLVALSGLGGLGKTQTAVEYAYQHREAYQAILWASAETVEALTSSFGVLCHVLRLPERTALAVVAVTRWLSHSSNWLLILDNAGRHVELTALRNPDNLSPFAHPRLAPSVMPDRCNRCGCALARQRPGAARSSQRPRGFGEADVGQSRHRPR